MATANENESENLGAFQDCLSVVVVDRLRPTTSKNPKRRDSKARKDNSGQQSMVAADTDRYDDAAELGDFVEYLADEIFPDLPSDLRTISWAVLQENASLGEKYSLPLAQSELESIVRGIPPNITESLSSHGLIESPDSLDRFIEHVLNNYIPVATAAPSEYTPAVAASRPSGCEICGREQLRLTYHHLIPRQMHGKAVKRGWHKDWELNKVAWLCRACHSYVHKIATNEELARELYDVELLLAREDVQRWAAWVGRVRWKAR